MKKYLIKAYGDYERRLKEQTKIIEAKDEEEAWVIAWKTFPEYRELGVWEYNEPRGKTISMGRFVYSETEVDQNG